MSLVVKDLQLIFEENLVFDKLSFWVEPGEFFVINGRNGSGKSSLCFALAGLIDEDVDGITYAGKVFFDNKEIKSMAQRERCMTVGIVFQNPDNQVFSSFVIEELVFALENLGIEREEIKRRLQAVANKLNISHLFDSKVNNLSGGEKHLVAFASILMIQPKVLIVDEITAKLDSENRRIVRSVLKDYVSQGNLVIMVSHLQEDSNLADKTLILGG